METAPFTPNSMTHEPPRPYNRRPPRSYQSNVHVLDDTTHTIRTLLNPFRVTEEGRHTTISVNLLNTIVRTLQDIVNKTSNLQQQIQLTNTNNYLKDVSNQIDHTNSERLRFASLFESLQVIAPITRTPEQFPHSPETTLRNTRPDETHISIESPHPRAPY